ncbi:MAG: transglutaminase domain-containing protein [Pseudomonadota bacterium]
MKKRFSFLIRFLGIIVSLAVIAIGILLSITSVSTNIDSSDEFVFENILTLKKINTSDRDYKTELNAIRYAQNLVLQIAPLGSPIPEYADREPIDLIKHRSGLCYDRSRTLDKAYKWMGFQTRHVYILYRKNGSIEKNFIGALLSYGWPSHAVTEVKTSHGWIIVDSNSAWISVDKQGEPVATDEIWKSAARFDNVPQDFLTPYWAIRGMYSRKGHLYKPYIPFPELNLHDMFDWLIYR